MNAPWHQPAAIPAAATGRGQAVGITLGWLWLAVFSLVAAGLMAVLLALSRTPFIQNLIDNPALFKVALVVHVDLSALIWFFACAGALWSALGAGPVNHWDRRALIAAWLGTLMVTAAPFVGAAEPLMNNYVPVLRHPWFFLGLGACVGGLVIQACRFIHLTAWRPPDSSFTITALLRLAMLLSAWVFLAAVASVLMSWLLMPQDAYGEAFYELLFWGGGHVLQFAYTVMLMAAWLVLAAAAGGSPPVAQRHLRWLFPIAVVPLIVVPWLYTVPLDQALHVRGFTELMRWGGLASLPLGLVALASVCRLRPHDAEGRRLAAAAVCSMGLFAAGGVLGFLISGSNTMVPAHYHGSIVAVTLALMGLVYYALPRLGRPITLPRTAHWQSYVYAAGQLMHVAGLAWCGGYGVQRKVAGAAQGLDGLAETAGMALMGLGGVVSVAGGIMFLVVAMTALLGGLWPFRVGALRGYAS